MIVEKNTVIMDILKNDPNPQEGCMPIFMQFGMHCLGCMAAHGETVEEACMVHGVDPEEVISAVNDYFAHV